MKKENKKKLTQRQISKLKNKSLKISIKEGASASTMISIADSYMTPFALALNANNAQIGFLNSLMSLTGPVSQLHGSKLMEKANRKKIVIFNVLMQALVWVPILFLIPLYKHNIGRPFLPYFLILFYSLYAVFAGFAYPSFFSWMGDLVPKKIRGRYFGKRNRVFGISGLITVIIASFLLDFFKTKGLVLLGFSILFFTAMIARIISVFYFKKQYHPELKLEKGHYFTLKDFIKKLPYNNFGRFVLFSSVIHFGTAIAGPFFAVYMLKNLNFSYTTFILVYMSSALFSLLMMPFWGKFADKYGNRLLLKIGALLLSIMPILWIFSTNPFYLIFIPQLINGFGLSALALSINNFIYDSVTIQKRGLCVAYHNVIMGFGLFIGATLGGLITQYLKINFMNIFLFVFLLSAIIKLISVFIFLPLVKEVRRVQHKPRLPMKHFHLMNGVMHGIPHKKEFSHFHK